MSSLIQFMRRFSIRVRMRVAIGVVLALGELAHLGRAEVQATR